MQNEFPNGKSSFLKSYFNITDYIVHNALTDEYLLQVQGEGGKEGLYHVATELTEDFEKRFRCKDEQSRELFIDSFLTQTFKQLNNNL